MTEIMTTCQLFATGRPMQAARAGRRSPQVWVKLPYGIPLCVGFLLYLGYVLVLRN